eukprot:sb/3468746/
MKPNTENIMAGIFPKPETAIPSTMMRTSKKIPIPMWMGIQILGLGLHWTVPGLPERDKDIVKRGFITRYFVNRGVTNNDIFPTMLDIFPTVLTIIAEDNRQQDRLLEVGRRLLEVGRHPLEVGRLLQLVGRLLLEAGRHPLEVGKRLQVGRLPLEVGRLSLEVGRLPRWWWSRAPSPWRHSHLVRSPPGAYVTKPSPPCGILPTRGQEGMMRYVNENELFSLSRCVILIQNCLKNRSTTVPKLYLKQGRS